MSRARSYKVPDHVAGHDLGIISPVYRGFKLHCTGADIERLKRSVDEYWSRRYFAEQTLTGREKVMREESELRFEPREWASS